MKRVRKGLRNGRKPTAQQQHATLEHERRAVGVTEALRRETELMRAVFNNAKEAIFILDAENPPRILDCNQAASNIFGYPKSEMLGKTTTFLHVSDRSLREFQSLLYSAIEQGLPFQMQDFKMRRRDGSAFSSELSVSQLLNDRGQRISWVSIVRDITERKRLEEGLRDLASFPSENPNPILRLDRHGVVLSANEASRALLQDWSSGTGQVAPKFWRDLVTNVLSSGESSDIDIEFGGRSFTFLVKPIMERDYVNLYGRDITDRKLAEEALRENEKRLTEQITELNEMRGELERHSKQLQESQEKLRALHQHASQLGSASNIDEIVKSTLDAIEFALGFDIAEVYIVGGDSVRMKGTRGAPIGLSEERLDGRGLVAKAARTQTTVRVSDTTEETDYVDRKGWDWTGPPTMLSELAVPIIIDKKTAGVLNVEDTRPSVFSDNDQMLLETLAAHVAVEMQRLRHLEDLRRSSQFLESVIENANVWLNVLDERKNVVIWNKAAERMSGYFREEVVGHGKIWEWLYPDQEYRNEITDSVNGVLQKGRVEQDVETSIRRKDGETRVISWNERNLLAENGKVIGSIAIGQDVTERKRMQEELRRYSTSLEQMVAERTGKLAESERRFRELANLLPQIVFETDATGNYTFVNRSGIVAVGYTEEEVYSGLNAAQTFIEADREKIKKSIGRILTGKAVHPHEFTALRKDGTTFPVLIHSAAIIHEGKPVGVRGVAMDITERKRMEEALRMSEERFRGIAERSIDGIFEMDLDGRLTYVSPSAEPGLGYKPEEVIGTRMERYLPELEIPKIAPTLAILMQGKNVIGLQGEMLRKDGTHIPAELNASPIFRDEKIVGVQGIVRDITERVKMENALRESEERYRRLFESSPVPLWEEDFSEVKKYFDHLRSGGVRDLRRHFVEDPEDVEKCASMVKILNVNESTLRLYEAKSVEELTGELSRILTLDIKDRFREELIALSEGKTRFAGEFDNRTLSGETRHVSLILNVVPGYEDTLAKVLISTVDLTERKKMEQLLQQTERLAAVGETAAMVGHDLRNPLQGITGALHLLKQESLTEKERDEMLQLIQDSVHYSDAIVRDLTDYSTEIHLEPMETTPKSIITDAVRTVTVPEKITLRDLSQEHPIIMVDQDRMRRVIVNLLENAIDAMPQGGTLTISSKQSDGTVEIAFSDTGLGMPEEVLKNLWKPLQTTKAKGLGLGLAICKRIVDAHGGDISVKSKIGEGTTLTVRLPTTPQTVEVKEK